MRMTHWVLLAALAAQPAQETFEVAAVTRNLSGSNRSSSDREPGGQVTIISNTLRDLIRHAFGLHESQLVGGPDWISNDYFDVVAKAHAGVTEPQVDAMMRALLREQFNLSVHEEQRTLPVYELVRARSDGSLGPRLRPRPDCAGREPGFDAQGQKPCGGTLFGPGRLTARGVEITGAVPGFARGRIVVDRTGLKGHFDVDLEWTPEPVDLPAGAAAPGGDGPSVFSALQEQLGLKLQPSSAVITVLVIDRVDPPKEN